MTLSLVILKSYTHSVTTGALNYCTSVTQKTTNYFSQKISLIKRIQQLPYYHEKLYGDVLLFDNATSNTYSMHYFSSKNTLDQYFMYMEDLDPSICRIHAYFTTSRYCYAYKPYNNKGASEQIFNLNLNTLSEPSKTNSFTPSLVPTDHYFSSQNLAAPNFTLAFNLRSKDLSHIVSTLFVTFDLNELTQLLAQDSTFQSNVIVYDLDGNIVYDSSHLATTSPDFNFDALKNTASDVTKTSKRLMITHINSDLGILITCAIENTIINQNTALIRKITYLITLICIFIALALSCFCMSFFSKRIHAICKGIVKVKEGNFKERIHIGQTEDELNLIATHFNYMCDSLEIYISQVYKAGLHQQDAKLKQKIAEYYALQSQVDPHFLFNTLESIRMSALSCENPKIPQMIYKLGSLFRSSIRQDMFVPLKNEIDYCTAYLELLQLRYEDYLITNFNIDSSLYQYNIIKHLLQPIIENAIVHGMDTDEGPLTIHITGQLIKENTIILTISDDGQGISLERLTAIQNALKNNLETHSKSTGKNSVGLTNINERIHLVYGMDYGLELISKEGKGTKVILKIPAKTEKELKYYVQSNVS